MIGLHTNKTNRK